MIWYYGPAEHSSAWPDSRWKSALSRRRDASPHSVSPWRSPSQWARKQPGRQADRQTDSEGNWPPSSQCRVDNRGLAMISPDFNFNILTRDLSHYLENQVKVGLFGSGVGLSLVLGFSAAYTCYYLLSVAKVSRNQHWIRLPISSQDANFTKDGTSSVSLSALLLNRQSSCWWRFRLSCIFPGGEPVRVHMCSWTRLSLPYICNVLGKLYPILLLNHNVVCIMLL